MDYGKAQKLVADKADSATHKTQAVSTTTNTKNKK